jgi:hypothetical protein
VGTIVALVEPSADPDRVQVLSQYLMAQDYTDAEIRYAARELPKDEHLDAKMRYGKPLTPADFERVISRIRRLRSVLSQQRIPEDRVQGLVEEMPELSREDFGQMGFDGQDNPVYTLRKEARQRLENSTDA